MTTRKRCGAYLCDSRDIPIPEQHIDKLPWTAAEATTPSVRPFVTAIDWFRYIVIISSHSLYEK